MNKKKLAFLQ